MRTGKLFIALFCFLFVCSTVFGQAPPREKRLALDTVTFGLDTAVLFSDKTWELLEDLSFTGYMNPYLRDVIEKDSSYLYKTDWENYKTYNYDNPVSKMVDSIWICVVDEQHPDFAMPVPNGPVTSRFGRRNHKWHKGIDLDLRVGDSVVSAFDGKVRYAKWNSSGYGNLVIVRHYNGLETYYAHLSKIKVKPNQKVKAGDLIAYGGNTGHSHGSHLHFEVRFYHHAINPEELINFHEGKLKSPNLFVHSGLFYYMNGSRRARSSVKYSAKPYDPSAPASKSTSTRRYHRVKSGETLWRISQRYKVDVSQLRKWNRLKSTDVIKTGQRLRVH